jgi:hypothetical protein
VEGEVLRRGLASIPILFSSLIVFLSSTHPGRADDTVTIRGYFKTFCILLVPPRITLDGSTLRETDMGAVNNRLRLKFTLQPSKWWSFDGEYDISPRIQDSRLFDESLFPTGQDLGGYRLVDLRDRLLPGPEKPAGNFALYQNLDRFVFTIKTPAADIMIGRQAVAWGSARVINPTDILAPFGFNVLDKEERTGVDAVRVRVPLGSLDELDVGVVAGDGFKGRTSAFFLRGKVNVLKTDVSITAMGFRDHLLLGLDLARAIGGAGSWLEVAYVVPDAFLRNGAAGGPDYFRASAGVDYNFSAKTYGFAEYHFNSAGRGEPEAYPLSLGTVPYRDGAVYLLGRHYMSVGSTYQITPLLPFTGLIIANLSDLSIMLAPSLEYNISQNIYVSGGAYIGIGRSPEIVASVPGPSLQPNLLHSEFGSFPDVVYASFRIYF